MRYAICVAMSRLMRPIVADATAVGAAPLPAVRSEAGGGVRASQVWALLPVGSAACGLSQVCASLCEPVQACAERRSECGGPWRRRRVRLTTIGSTCDGAGEVSTLVDMAMGAQCTSSPSRPVQACASLCKHVRSVGPSATGRGADDGCGLRRTFGLGAPLAATREHNLVDMPVGSQCASRVRAGLCEPVRACPSLCGASIRVHRDVAATPGAVYDDRSDLPWRWWRLEVSTLVDMATGCMRLSSQRAPPSPYITVPTAALSNAAFAALSSTVAALASAITTAHVIGS